ncbi:MAG: metallophosphoesterase family protein [Mariprofundaceae bacterium]|nr:metallophosphoesterase family protein [Mariprofundaceae bacterium]
MENTVHQENIQIIGNLGQDSITIQDIIKILEQDNMELSHEGEFIGKTTTHLKFNEQHVLKLHPNKHFSEHAIAVGWLSNLIEEEREADVYHPSRTWFIREQGDGWHLGNITQRLTPIHTFFELPDFPTEKGLQFIAIICDMYFSYNTRCGKRLDEGLSNFGFIDGKVYYLDDDIFNWDHFLAFSAWIAGWLRRYSNTWMNIKRSRQLGEILHSVLNKYFNQIQGIDAPHIVAEQLKDMFFPLGNIQNSADHIIEILAIYKMPESTSDISTTSSDTIEDVFAWLDDHEPIAILSDIHANLPALKATLDDIDRQGIDRIFILGDLVGYGPHPKECLELLQKRGLFSLRGNHDHAIGTGNMVRSMTSSSSQVAEWTIDQLPEDQRLYLCNLPLKITNRPWMSVHGAPMDPTCFNGYVYETTALKNLQWLLKNSYKYCLHGHSHFQGIYILDGHQSLHIKENIKVDLSQEQAALICPGSVGQPRDGKTDACYAIIDPRQAQVELKHVPYEFRDVVQDMIIHQFPEQLIHRLKTGT